MTRKDFEKIACAVRATEMNDKTRKALAFNLAAQLATTNPLFSVTRFVDACGVV